MKEKKLPFSFIRHSTCFFLSFIFSLTVINNGYGQNPENIKKLKVKKGHPILFVTPEMVEQIRGKTDALESFHNYVKLTREKNTDDPKDTVAIRSEVDEKTSKDHIDYYINDCMMYGVDAYINQHALSKAYAKQYILSILDHDISGDDMIIRGRLFALGTLYDWMYDDLSDQVKKDMRQKILDMVDYVDKRWHYISRANAGGHSRFGNISVLVGLLPLFHDVQPDNADRYLKYLGYTVNNWINIFNPLQEWINRGGSHSMGWAYGASYSTFYPYMVWEFATDEPSWLTDWQRDKAYFNLYGLRNDYNEEERTNGAYDNFPFWEDVWASEYAPNLQGLQVLFSAGYYHDPYAQWFYNHMKKRNINGWMFKDNPWDILYNNFSENDGNSPDDLPLSRYFPHTGFVIMRDSWDFAKNTLMIFKSSSFYAAGHHHKDQNAFTIYYKGPLAIDAGTYEATGGWGSSHFWNYYTRSVAHNTMLIYDPSEKFNGYSNDGGQRFFAIDDPALKDVIEGGANHLDGIQRYEHTPDYTYTMGNATKAYNSSKLSLFTRSIVYLPKYSYNHPAIIIYDKVITTNPDFKKTYLLHSIREPAVDSTMVTITIDDGMETNNKSKLFQETLLPLHAKIVKIGGRENNQEFYVADDGHGNPHNYNEEAAYENPSERQKRELREGGQWRVEISPPDSSLENEFLHVLSVSDGTDNFSPVKTQYLSSENLDGVIVSNNNGHESTLVLFCKNNEPLNDFIRIPENMDFQKVLIAGLDTNSYYSVTRSDSGFVFRSSSPGHLKSSGQGTLFLNDALQPVLAYFNYKVNQCTSSVTCSGHTVYKSDTILWLWDFGDGNTSMEQNPVHTYDTAGSYLIKLITSAGTLTDTSEKEINILPVISMPEVTDNKRCGNGSLLLTAKGGGGEKNKWYDVPIGGEVVALTDTFITPELTASKTYYVSSTISTPPAIFFGAKPDSSGGGGYYPWDDEAAIRGLIFDVSKYITLKSVKVYNDTGQASVRTISILNNIGTEIASKQIMIPEGESKLELNFQVAPGNNYFIRAADPHKGLYRNSGGVSFPYQIDDAVTITSSDVGTQYYYFFYDWEVEVSGDSSSCRVPVHAIIIPPAKAAFRYEGYDSTIFFTNISQGDYYQWDFGDGTTSEEKNPVHTYPGFGNYNVQLTVSNSCGMDSMGKIVTVEKSIELPVQIIKNDHIFTLYPNPASDMIHIRSDIKPGINGVIHVFNVSGNMVKSTKTTHLDSFQLNIADLPAGIYFMTLASGQPSFSPVTLKFLIIK